MPATCLVLKLRTIRKARMVWSRTQFESVKKQKLHLPDSLNKLYILLESRLVTFDECSLKISSLNDLERIQRLEEIMWQQRARFLWLTHGDHNSKFFFTVSPTQGTTTTSFVYFTNKGKFLPHTWIMPLLLTFLVCLEHLMITLLCMQGFCLSKLWVIFSGHWLPLQWGGD